MISFIIGLFVGSFFGVMLMALMAMAKDAEPKLEKPNPNYKPPMGKAKAKQKEPTILWTKGNLCMWKGKLCEIERFDTTANNQTVVHLRREGLDYGLCVPVEELEAVEE